MFNKYYQQELQNLRELARDFSRVHPAISPMLSGTTSDPDVERLLEGSAFLTGLLRQKLDNEFPEIIHGLTDIIFPHLLRPVPSTSIVMFSPKPSLQETTTVKAGTSLASIPVDGINCIFKTCFDTEVHPLSLISADLVQQAETPDRIRLVFELKGLNVSQWNPRRLGFFLGESYTQATELYMLLTHFVEKIVIHPQSDGDDCVMPPANLVPTGLELHNSLIPYPARSFQGYRLLFEYFLLPQKFLFLELRGWDQWRNRGEGTRFEISFELKPAPSIPQSIKTSNFLFYVTPVVNLFTDDSDQFTLDHRLEKVRVRPATKNKDHYHVFSVDKVVGYEQGSVTPKKYSPLEYFSFREQDSSIYQVTHSRSPIDDSPEHYLSFTYPPDGEEPKPETLNLTLTYTNGSLPERLQHGDICIQTSDSPGLLDFRNIIPPTPTIEPMLGGNTLWQFLSHLSLNFLSLADVVN
ncbi:MAG: type VI secretion system baseplate subunit TssF, partial [Candidatus Latescibacteria bacterium]|nr:type VI secretion system baseplate subunit TssF [Candidatus Latescibacterota bacterium]